MAYTGNPSTNTRDSLRLLIGDISTSTGSELFSDAEVDYFLSAESNTYSAAAQAARALAMQYADEVDKAVGDLRISLSQKARRYESLARFLDRRSRVLAHPALPARSVSDKDDAEADTDRTAPSFVRGQFDHPEAGGD